jgi:hypothetical protein
MGDLFHEDCPDEWIDKVFAVMALAPQHTFQVLTKRAERMRAYSQRRRSLPISARKCGLISHDEVLTIATDLDQARLSNYDTGEMAPPQRLARCLNRTPAGSRRTNPASAADTGCGQVHFSGAVAGAD